MTVAYLTSEYPALSHTFIRREIAALRAAGLTIAPFTIRPTSDGCGSLHAAARAETEAVLGRKPLTYSAALGAGLLNHPLRWFSTLCLALRHRPPGLRALVWALFHFIEAMLLVRLLRRTSARHLHVHFANSGATVGLLAAHFLAMPWSMTLHGISETDYPAGILLGEKIARANFVACASWYMRAQAMRHADPEHWDKLHVVRCGIEPGDSAAWRDEDDERPVRFVCVGRLAPEKGQRGLLEALRGLRDDEIAAHLELVGDGPERLPVEAAVRALDLEGVVVFAGQLSEEETLARIARADALIVPSFMEGLPMVLIEAMAAGTPVIASAVAGIPELVAHGESGLLFRASDWLGLRHAMAELARDPALRHRLGEAGREAVADEFAIHNAVLPLLALFGERSHDA